MTRRKAMPRRRPGFVYAFWGYDPYALLRGVIRIVLLYIGQTRQKPETRWRQHQYGSPNGEPPKIWWPLVVRKEVLLSAIYISDSKLDSKEWGRIFRMHPLLNDKGNRLNPKRIPIYDHKKVMAQIDAAGGVAALVARAEGRHRTVAGWHIERDSKGRQTGAVTWYGRDAQRVGTEILEEVGAQWKSCENQSIGSLSSSGLESGELPESIWKRAVSGITELVRQ